MGKASYETQDAIYDVAWSEVHENQLVTASGDGSIRLWDVMLKVRSGFSRYVAVLTMNRTSLSGHGMNIHERSTRSIGLISKRILLYRHLGMGL